MATEIYLVYIYNDSDDHYERHDLKAFTSRANAISFAEKYSDKVHTDAKEAWQIGDIYDEPTFGSTGEESDEIEEMCDKLSSEVDYPIGQEDSRIAIVVITLD